MLTLNHTALHKIKVHAMQTYPEECCGVLLGSDESGVKKVDKAVKIENAMEENRERRFLVTPESYRSIELQARQERLQVIGIYHSHPDHRAAPSTFDLENALPSWSYVIVSVESGIPSKVTSWLLKEDRSGFEEETMMVLDGEFKHVVQ